MGVAALFGSIDIPIHTVVLLFHLMAPAVIYGDLLRRQHGHLPVLHVGNIPGVADDGGDIGGDKVLPLAVAQQQRRILSGGNEHIRCIGGHNTQGIGPFYSTEHPPNGLQHVPTLFIIIIQQLRHHLGVCFGFELVALVQKLTL